MLHRVFALARKRVSFDAANLSQDGIERNDD
jgi:hypothetical protein